MKLHYPTEFPPIKRGQFRHAGDGQLFCPFWGGPVTAWCYEQEGRWRAAGPVELGPGGNARRAARLMTMGFSVELRDCLGEVVF